MDLLFSPLTVAVLVTLALLALGFAFRPNPQTRAMQARVEEYVERKDDVEDPTAALQNLQGSFISRAVVPALRRVLQTLGRLAPSHTLDTIAQRLTAAGRPGNLNASDFLGLCIVLAATGAVLGFLYARGMPDQPGLVLFGPLVGGGMGFLGPRYWLVSRVARRQESIQRTLPDALDMLTVCVEAGLAFESALQRVSERWSGALSDEFSRVVAEVRLGVPRSQALRRMAQRCSSPDMSSFVAVLVQADSMGTSIAQVIHSQADQIRVLRRQRAEEKANKAPIKVLVPMVLFIFPALFVVILGPGVPTILEALGSASGK